MPNALLTYGLLAALAIALAVAAATDIATRRISNRLNAAIALAAPLFWWASGLSLWPGVAVQLALAAVTLALCAGLFAIRAIGGGDVKLLTALALWIEPAAFARLVVAMALLGGVLTLLMIAGRGRRRGRKPLAVPYGVAIAAAGLWVLASGALGPEGAALIAG